jgi:hypothetical protein
MLIPYHEMLVSYHPVFDRAVTSVRALIAVVAVLQGSPRVM